ncbi:hypothetical protein MMC25_007703 [Agyrium rufum]|nr:hypothetical protein [Agyrium rufum]
MVPPAHPQSGSGPGLTSGNGFPTHNRRRNSAQEILNPMRKPGVISRFEAKVTERLKPDEKEIWLKKWQSAIPAGWGPDAINKVIGALCLKRVEVKHLSGDFDNLLDIGWYNLWKRERAKFKEDFEELRRGRTSVKIQWYLHEPEIRERAHRYYNLRHELIDLYIDWEKWEPQTGSDETDKEMLHTSYMILTNEQIRAWATLVASQKRECTNGGDACNPTRVEHELRAYISFRRYGPQDLPDPAYLSLKQMKHLEPSNSEQVDPAAVIKRKPAPEERLSGTTLGGPDKGPSTRQHEAYKSLYLPQLPGSSAPYDRLSQDQLAYLAELITGNKLDQCQEALEGSIRASTMLQTTINEIREARKANPPPRLSANQDRVIQENLGDRRYQDQAQSPPRDIGAYKDIPPLAKKDFGPYSLRELYCMGILCSGEGFTKPLEDEVPVLKVLGEAQWFMNEADYRAILPAIRLASRLLMSPKSVILLSSIISSKRLVEKDASKDSGRTVCYIPPRKLEEVNERFKENLKQRLAQVAEYIRFQLFTPIYREPGGIRVTEEPSLRKPPHRGCASAISIDRRKTRVLRAFNTKHKSPLGYDVYWQNLVYVAVAISRGIAGAVMHYVEGSRREPFYVDYKKIGIGSVWAHKVFHGELNVNADWDNLERPATMIQ